MVAFSQSQPYLQQKQPLRRARFIFATVDSNYGISNRVTAERVLISLVVIVSTGEQGRVQEAEEEADEAPEAVEPTEKDGFSHRGPR